MNTINGTEWDQAFLEAWAVKTVMAGPDSDWNGEKYEDYIGPDYSVVNRGVRSRIRSDENGLMILIGREEFDGHSFPIYEMEEGWIWFGGPYRKEVYPDDNLGTYIQAFFRIRDGVIVEVEQYESESRPAWFEVNGGRIEFKVGLDLKELSDDPVRVVEMFNWEPY